MSNSWQKWVLIIAGIWNLLGASALLDPAKHFQQLYTRSLSLDDPLQLFFYRCTWINVIAWGIGYLVAAFVPTSRKAILIAGGAGKFVYALACFSLFSTGIGKPFLVLTAIIDLMFASLFAFVVLSQRKVLN
jgi:hypothetical protein